MFILLFLKVCFLIGQASSPTAEEKYRRRPQDCIAGLLLTGAEREMLFRVYLHWMEGQDTPSDLADEVTSEGVDWAQGLDGHRLENVCGRYNVARRMLLFYGSPREPTLDPSTPPEAMDAA